MNLVSFKVFLRRTAVVFSRSVMTMFSRTYDISRSPVVILAPHQDDETLACGSFIARKRHEGHEVHIVFLTDGGASHPGNSSLPPHELIALRRREAMAALEVLVVDPACVHFCDEPDGTLNALSRASRHALTARLACLFGEIQPGRLFVPCSPDGSSEHDPVLGFAQEALTMAGIQSEIWQYPVWCWWNPVLLMTNIFKRGEIHRLKGEDYHALKQKALSCYRSQVEPISPTGFPPLPAELKEFCLRDPEYFFVTKAKYPVTNTSVN
ncbi:MAG TPA: PIG-L family deacetylase [Lacunisphaera sp.]|jgi:LmbE family N-acetylglucosaminyl deacetylase